MTALTEEGGTCHGSLATSTVRPLAARRSLAADCLPQASPSLSRAAQSLAPSNPFRTSLSTVLTAQHPALAAQSAKPGSSPAASSMRQASPRVAQPARSLASESVGQTSPSMARIASSLPAASQSLTSASLSQALASQSPSASGQVQGASFLLQASPRHAQQAPGLPAARLIAGYASAGPAQAASSAAGSFQSAGSVALAQAAPRLRLTLQSCSQTAQGLSLSSTAQIAQAVSNTEQLASSPQPSQSLSLGPGSSGLVQAAIGLTQPARSLGSASVTPASQKVLRPSASLAETPGACPTPAQASPGLEQASPIPIQTLPSAALGNGSASHIPTPKGEVPNELPTRQAKVLRRVLVSSSLQRSDSKEQHSKPEDAGCSGQDVPANSDEETASTKSSDHEGQASQGGTTAPVLQSGSSTEELGATCFASAAKQVPPPPAPVFGTCLPGEPLAFDERGQPIIVRQVDLQTGKTRHIVCNEDGSVRTFGESTVESLLSSAKNDSRKWLESLTDRDVRGLVHEVGRRLLMGSQLYQQQQEELSKLADASDYDFFGLTPDSTEKELDNAYRRLAKQMHPDKNGGTEQAKQRFQRMKERYEGLKSRRHGSQNGPSQKDEDDEEEEGDEEEEEDSENEKGEEDIGEEEQDKGESLEAYGEDGMSRRSRRRKQRKNRKKRDNSRIEFDPTDRSSLDKTVWKMLGQLRMLQQGLKDISRRLGKSTRHL